MKRKAVKLGPSTLVVSLPSTWIKRMEVESGDELYLEELENDLLVRSEKKNQQVKKTTIELANDNEQDLEPLLTHAYRKGFDHITVKNADPKKVKTIAEKLLGFEITKKSPDECVLENIAEPTEQKYDVLLRRSFLIIKETITLFQEDCKKNDLKHLKETQEYRQQQDKFILFCRRILIKEKQSDLQLEWELLTFLMHIQHALYYMYEHAAINGIKKDSDLLKTLQELQTYFNYFYESYFKKDINLIHKINTLKTELHFGKLQELLEKNKNTVVYAYIREIFRLIQIGTSPILARLL